MSSITVKVKCRCRDYKYWRNKGSSGSDDIKVCFLAGYYVGANGFCVYAEKKELTEKNGGITPRLQAGMTFPPSLHKNLAEKLQQTFNDCYHV